MWKSRLQIAFLFAIVAIARFAYADPTPTEYKNPLNNVTTFPALIEAIAKAARDVGLPLAAVAIIFAGFKFVIAAAQGDQAGLTAARKMLWYVLLGSGIIVGAYVIATVVVNTIKNFSPS